MLIKSNVVTGENNKDSVLICDFCLSPSARIFNSQVLQLSKYDFDICETCLVFKARERYKEVNGEHRLKKWEDDIRKEREAIMEMIKERQKKENNDKKT
jgi:protein-arginine kinase activator protein McsA